MFKKMRTKIFLGLGILFLGLLTCIFLPNVGSNKGKTEYLLIPHNATFESVMDSLDKKESVFSSLSFSLCAHMAGYPHKIKEGRYELKKGLNNLHLLNNLIKGRQKPIRITFNNIRTKEQLCARLSNQLMFDSTEIFNKLSDNSFLEKYGLNTYTSVCLFIPNTYEVYWNISVNDFIEKMNAEYLKFWTTERKEKAEKAKLSPCEVSTLASIVEEESNLTSEKPMIAGLYLNRYHSGMPLQADPTIKFAVGDFSIKRVLFKHIEESAKSPYNTYINKGLPPGPIRIPSVESLDAVLNYKQHPYFFMCAKGSGGQGHDFAVTFQQHLQNANRYRNEMDKLGLK